MNKRDKVVMRKIIDETAMISRMLSGTCEPDFLQNEEKQRAVCMTLINIGELVKNLTEETRISSPHIPWKDIAGLRDVAAHGYFTLRMDDIWIYATKELPLCSTQIEEILQNAESDNLWQ